MTSQMTRNTDLMCIWTSVSSSPTLIHETANDRRSLLWSGISESIPVYGDVESSARELNAFSRNLEVMLAAAIGSSASVIGTQKIAVFALPGARDGSAGKLPDIWKLPVIR
jgi:hypothetical protein